MNSSFNRYKFGSADFVDCIVSNTEFKDDLDGSALDENRQISVTEHGTEPNILSITGIISKLELTS